MLNCPDRVAADRFNLGRVGSGRIIMGLYGVFSSGGSMPACISWLSATEDVPMELMGSGGGGGGDDDDDDDDTASTSTKKPAAPHHRHPGSPVYWTMATRSIRPRL